MRKRAYLFSIAVVIGCVLSRGAAARTNGTPAPDVAIQDAQGATVHLGAYKGHVVLIDFWASWCTSCKVSFPALDALSREYEPRGLVVLAVNVDERRHDADTFLAAHPHSMTVLFDPKGAAPSAFDVRAMPTSFVIDKAGLIRFTHVGYSGDVVEQYRSEIAPLLAQR